MIPATLGKSLIKNKEFLKNSWMENTDVQNSDVNSGKPDTLASPKRRRE
jgi:hypothetical protein